MIGQNETDEVIWCFILGEKGASYVREERGDSDKIMDLIAFYLEHYVSEGMKQKILDILDTPYTTEDKQTMKSHESDLGFRKRFIIAVLSRLSFSTGFEEKLIKCAYDKSQEVAELTIALLGKNKSVKAIKAFEEITEFYRNNPEADFNTSYDKTGYTGYRIEYIIDALGNYNDPQTLNLLTELSRHKHFFKKEVMSSLAKRKEVSLVSTLLEEFNNNEKLFYATISGGGSSNAWKNYNRRLVEICKDLAHYEGDPLVKERLSKFITSDIAKYDYKILSDEHQGYFSYREALNTLTKINGAKELISYLRDYEIHDDYVRDRVETIISCLGACDYHKLSMQEKNMLLEAYQRYFDYLYNSDGYDSSVHRLEKIISENLFAIADDRAQGMLSLLNLRKNELKHKTREYGYSQFKYNSIQDANNFLEGICDIDSGAFRKAANMNFFSNLRTSGFRIELTNDIVIFLTSYSGKPTKRPFIRLTVKRGGKELYSMDFKSKRLSFLDRPSKLIPLYSLSINPQLGISFQDEQIVISSDEKFLGFEILYTQIYSGAERWHSWWRGPSGNHQTAKYILDILRGKLYKIKETDIVEG